MLRKLFIFFSFCFIFLFSACVSRPVVSAEDEALLYPVATYVPESFDWQEVYNDEGVVSGVWCFDYENKELPLIYHAVKIDLSLAQLKICCSQWENTADFAKREACVVAMNATPFGKNGLAGIYKVGGEVLSWPVSRYSALALNCDEQGVVYEARIIVNQTDAALKDYDYAFGGFFTVLENGGVLQEFIRRCDSRSGTGISADGKTLYLLAVEGEWISKSIGLSYPQCGEIFRAMGCSDAMEFDGGDSSDLCINGRSVLSYNVRRIQGNSFGLIRR